MQRKRQLSIQRLVGLCKRIEDPRRVWGNKRHELFAILVIALLSIISGCESWEEIHDYGKMKQKWLRSILPLPNGIPSESTFRRVFARIKPEALEEAYREWVWPYIGSCHEKQICVDGKTVRGVSKRSEQRLHMVSAWVREDGIALGQVKTQEKSNEITAIPNLLNALDIRGSVVSIDAMGCQRNIAKTIITREAHYLLAVKDNQPTLHEDIKEYFAWAREDSVEKSRLIQHTEVSFDHGRTTRWRVLTTKDTVWFEDKSKWVMLHTLICVERKTERAGNTSIHTAYYISSLDADAAMFLRLTRGHWSVENQLHWLLDVTFCEDSSLVYKDHAPVNLSLLRKMALSLLRLDASSKASVARKRRMAAYDNDFALSLLTLE